MAAMETLSSFVADETGELIRLLSNLDAEDGLALVVNVVYCKLNI